MEQSNKLGSTIKELNIKLKDLGKLHKVGIGYRNIQLQYTLLED